MLSDFQKAFLEAQYLLNENWSRSKQMKIADFLELKLSKVYKWHYD